MGTGDASTVGHVASATGGSGWKTSRSGPCNRARIDMHPTVPFRSLAAVWPDGPARRDLYAAVIGQQRFNPDVWGGLVTTASGRSAARHVQGRTIEPLGRGPSDCYRAGKWPGP